MKNLRKSIVFQGLERVRAPKLEPLGSKSRAQRGSGRAKGASDRAAEGSGLSFGGLLNDFIAKVAIS